MQLQGLLPKKLAVVPRTVDLQDDGEHCDTSCLNPEARKLTLPFLFSIVTVSSLGLHFNLLSFIEK